MATILIATGDTAVFDILASEISAERHRVVWAVDGQEVYETVLSDCPDLVILDMPLPVFNAFETCRILRADPAVPPELPIFLLSDDELSGREREKTRLTGQIFKIHSVFEIRDLLVRHIPAEKMP